MFGKNKKKKFEEDLANQQSQTNAMLMQQLNKPAFSNMRPSLSSSDGRNGWNGDVEMPTYRCLRPSVFQQLADDNDVTRFEFANSNPFSPSLGLQHFHFMFIVFKEGTPFKILGAIIQALSVLVVDLRFSLRRYSQKCETDKAMNRQRFFDIASTQNDGLIAVSCQVEFEDAPRYTPCSVSYVPPYTAIIRDAVKTFVAGYRLPNFGCDSIFVSHDLSLLDRLKLWLDPLRKRPFLRGSFSILSQKTLAG